MDVGAGNLTPVEPVSPSVGWGVLHLYYRVDRDRAERDPEAGKRIVDAVASLEADGHQSLCVAVLGHKADLGVMALGPDLARLQTFQQELLAAPLEPTLSYVSLTELSEYASSEDDERRRLEEEEGVTGDEAEERLAAWRERMAHYREHRLHPRLPAKRLLCFYPMSKRRTAEANWYELPFEERKRLMGGHARVGRGYAGRVLQLITGSTGIDDWEWGVTLLADDPVALKDIVQEMRFDPVSARYAEFGPFLTGLVLPAAEACERVGLRVGGGR
ncbi:MAG: heme peroxidase [Acidimicrobiia bacterium]|nr:MAG: heme peroxidase [Acidimicrobiia bacterium]